MSIRLSKSEQAAFDKAVAAMQNAEGGEREKLAVAFVTYREALPPRPRKAVDRKPDLIAAGQAARRTLDAADRGWMSQPLNTVFTMVGRAAIQAAVPNIAVRRAKGKPDLLAAGRAADTAYDRMDKMTVRPADDVINAAIGRAAVKAAWMKPYKPGPKPKRAENKGSQE